MDTKLFVRQQPGGMFAVLDKSFCHGNIYWVGSTITGASDTAGFGRNPDAPFATLNGAIDNAPAASGDVIFLLPGHAESETVAATAIATMDVAGVKVIGLGTGSLIPTFTIGAADATFSITAANCVLENVKIISDIADCAIGITVGASADGLNVRNCWFTDGGLTKELVIGLQLAAACDNCRIENNRFFTTVSADTGGCASGIKLAGESANTWIANNQFLGNYSVACIDASTAASTNVVVIDNVLCNLDADAGLVYSGHASSYNVLARNVGAGNKNNTHPYATLTATWCLANEGIDLPAVGTIRSPAAGAFA